MRYSHYPIAKSIEISCLRPYRQFLIASGRDLGRSGGILPILKCDCCKDGYLIVRKKDYQPSLGCTNYKEDKSGCNRRINLTYYENMLKRGEIEL